MKLNSFKLRLRISWIIMFFMVISIWVDHFDKIVLVPFCLVSILLANYLIFSHRCHSCYSFYFKTFFDPCKWAFAIKDNCPSCGAEIPKIDLRIR
jgi:hypothetical protein